MDVFLGLLQVVLREGMIYGIMAMGVYITYKVLNFADLSVDGTFPLGACMAAALITAGINPWLTLIICFVAGCLAGSVTGLLHVKLRISDLMSGILVQTALYSVNMVVTDKKAVLSIFNMPTIFSSGVGGALYNTALDQWAWVIMALLITVVAKIILDLYLKTRSGLLLRAVGSNERFVVSQGKDPGNMKIIGLMIGNGLVALSGAVLAQQKESADASSGTGMVVMALAAVIIGQAVFGHAKRMRGTTMAIVGMTIYRICLTAAMQFGLDTIYLKALMSILFVAALVGSRMKDERSAKNVIRAAIRR
ncbi:MAG: ABC transporter permease [Lachnospiraceae bacterium]|nr:ABC transporter permease [Lachnospiraceae bacterium]